MDDFCGFMNVEFSIIYIDLSVYLVWSWMESGKIKFLKEVICGRIFYVISR